MSLRQYILVLLSGLPFAAQAQLPDLIPYRKGDLWGYADSTGKIIIQPQWASASLFYDNGLAYVGCLYRTSHNDSDQYEQVINKKGQYLFTYRQVDSIMKKYNPKRYPYEWYSMRFDQNYIIIEYAEARYLYYTFDRRLIFNTYTNDGLSDYGIYGEEDPSPYTYPYLFNRQLKEVKGLFAYHYEFCDNFGKPLDIGHFDDIEENYGPGFAYYQLFRWIDKKDTLLINPKGPAAVMIRKKEALFIDTSGTVLFRAHRDSLDNHLHTKRHPLDTGVHAYHVRPVLSKSLREIFSADGIDEEAVPARVVLYNRFRGYKDIHGRVYYEP